MAALGTNDLSYLSTTRAAEIQNQVTHATNDREAMLLRAKRGRLDP